MVHIGMMEKDTVAVVNDMKCQCGSSETKLVFGFLKACKGCGSCPPRYVKESKGDEEE